MSVTSNEVSRPPFRAGRVEARRAVSRGASSDGDRLRQVAVFAVLMFAAGVIGVVDVLGWIGSSLALVLAVLVGLVALRSGGRALWVVGLCCLSVLVGGVSGTTDEDWLARSLALVVLMIAAWPALRAIRRRDQAADSGGRAAEDGRERETAANGDEHEFDELFRHIFESSLIGIAILDDGGRITRSNTAFCTMLGYSMNELAGKRMVDLAPTTDTHQIAAAAVPFNAPREPELCEMRLVRKDCKLIWVNVTFSTARDEYGAFRFGLAMIEDNTDRRLAEEQLRLREGQLARASRIRTVGAMAAGLAHEINQPLSAVTNYAEACLHRIRSGHANSAEIRADLEQIAEQAERAGAIVQRLRSFVKQRRSERRPIDCNACIREVLQFSAAELAARRAEVRLQLAEPLPRVLSDPIELQQVLLNLLRNALDALDESPLPEHHVVIETAPLDPDAVEISVRDNGPGLPPDIFDRVFRPFFSTKTEGLGVGLAICRTIVELHGGRMWAEANTPTGTVFRFTLPRYCGSEPDHTNPT